MHLASYDLSLGGGAKTIHVFEIPDPKLTILFVTFMATRRKLSHVAGKNSVFFQL